MNKPDPYIEILRYGSKMEPVNPQTLMEYLNDHEIYFHEGVPVTLHTTLFRNIFSAAFEDGNGNRPNFSQTGMLYTLRLEALGQLVAHKSLQQAKADSSKAIKIANKFFYLAMAVGIVQIVVSILLSIKGS